MISGSVFRATGGTAAIRRRGRAVPQCPEGAGTGRPFLSLQMPPDPHRGEAGTREDKRGYVADGGRMERNDDAQGEIFWGGSGLF